MHDLEPATRALAGLLSGIGDGQLGAATPCEAYTLGDLLDHVDGLALAFTWAAAKDERAFDGGAPEPDAGRLGDDWRTRIPARLDTLAAAWREPAAWQGMTKAGGVDLPGDIAGRVALNEVVVHGWDIARSTGQSFDPGEETIATSLAFLAAAAEESGESPFGPPVDVPEDATAFDRVIGLSGRSPAWPAH